MLESFDTMMERRIVTNSNLSPQDVAEVVKPELDHVIGIKENVSTKRFNSNYSSNKKLVENYTDIDSFQKLKNIVDSVTTITEEIAEDISEEDTYIDTVYKEVISKLEKSFDCEIFIEPSTRGFYGDNFIWINGQDTDYTWDFVQEYIDILDFVKEADSEQEFLTSLENYLRVHVNNAMDDLPEEDDEDLDESIKTRKQNSVKTLKDSYDEDQYEYQIFVNDEVLDDYFEDKDLAYAKAKKLKRSKYYNGEKIYKIELWRAPLGELDGELYDVILDESYNNSKLNQLKESLGTVKYNKIQKLIKECLKEGMEVEITIPKKRK